jgi:hypothetical protein
VGTGNTQANCEINCTSFSLISETLKEFNTVTLFSILHTELCSTGNDVTGGRWKQINLLLSVSSSVHDAVSVEEYDEYGERRKLGNGCGPFNPLQPSEF